MVSVNPNPAQGFHFFDSIKMGLPGTNCSGAVPEDLSKKVRKPYTITKSRESWTEQEHDKFLEALQLFDRDWKKIEAYVGSKSVIQIRSHAQKYFLKVQKSGTSEHVPPPRPKRKAAHPYPQKAPKVRSGAAASEVTVSAASVEPAFIYWPDDNPVRGSSTISMPTPCWNYSTMPPFDVPQPTKDDVLSGTQAGANNCCYSSSNDSTQTTRSVGQKSDHGNDAKKMKVMPDFAQVYRFIGSAFDPNATGQLQKLKQMDPVNVETIVLLIRNLCFNLLSPEFEDLKKLLSSYDADTKTVKPARSFSISRDDQTHSSVVLSA